MLLEGDSKYSMRRVFMIKISPSILLLSFVLFFFVSSETRAATITVTTADDIVATDGQCSLREAILRANATRLVFLRLVNARLEAEMIK